MSIQVGRWWVIDQVRQLKWSVEKGVLVYNCLHWGKVFRMYSLQRYNILQPDSVVPASYLSLSL